MLVVLLFIALQALTLLAALEVFPSLTSSPGAVAAVGVLALGGSGALGVVGFRACGCTFSWTAAFFAVTGWSATIDLILSLSLLGATPLGKFYVETGEEYFKSAWGFLVLMWDGTAHFALQLFLAHSTLLGRPCRLAGLVWAGSIINSMPVLLLGGATGVYSADIKPSTALNAPYVLVPIAYLSALLAAPSTEEPKEAGRKATAAAATPKLSTPAAYAWAAAHALAVVVHAWRAVVVMGSRAPLALQWVESVEPVLAQATRPSFGFLRVQCLVFAFYYIPFHAWACYALLMARPAKGRTLTTWATVFAGGYAQAQATCGGAALLSWTGFEPLAPQSVPAGGWALGLALALLPAAFAVHLHVAK